MNELTQMLTQRGILLPGGGLTFPAFVALAMSVVAFYTIFQKAGEPGWKSFIPFYNAYLFFEIVYGEGLLAFIMLVPIGNIIFYWITMWKLGKAFGKSDSFCVGLILAPRIFMLILGLGDATYRKWDTKKFRQNDTKIIAISFTALAVCVVIGFALIRFVLPKKLVLGGWYISNEIYAKDGDDILLTFQKDGTVWKRSSVGTYKIVGRDLAITITDEDGQEWTSHYTLSFPGLRRMVLETTGNQPCEYLRFGEEYKGWIQGKWEEQPMDERQHYTGVWTDHDERPAAMPLQLVFYGDDYTDYLPEAKTKSQEFKSDHIAVLTYEDGKETVSEVYYYEIVNTMVHLYKDRSDEKPEMIFEYSTYCDQGESGTYRIVYLWEKSFDQKKQKEGMSDIYLKFESEDYPL
ncbi:MAG: DUF5684 domain-containing protein [Lachnospiraceae bacterium]|nr:DUF5684 domain-containing protein [Lachnospiraceae bacterium]